MIARNETIVKYSACAEGVEFASIINAKSDNDSVREIRIWNEGKDTLLVEFYLPGIDSWDKALKIAKQEMVLVADRLCFEFDSPVTDIKLAGITLPQHQYSQRLRILDGVKIHAKVEAKGKIIPGESRVAKFKKKLEQPHSEADLVLRLYQLAFLQEDALSQFMILYHILLFLAGDKQKEVDSLIQKFYPEVEVSISPKDGKTQESIFTRLRNELAHNRPDVHLQITMKEIIDRVGKLKEITRSAILEKFDL